MGTTTSKGWRWYAVLLSCQMKAQERAAFWRLSAAAECSNTFRGSTRPESFYTSTLLMSQSSSTMSEQHQTLLEFLQSREGCVMHRGEQSQHRSLPRRPAFFYPDLLSQALLNKLTGSSIGSPNERVFTFTQRPVQ